MMKFLLKRNKEFIFTPSCWMSTQVCIYLCPVLVIIDSMFQSSLYYPPSFYSFCHLLQMLLKPLLTFIILMTVQIVSYRSFPFSSLTWCRRHSICHTIVFIVFLFLVMMKFHGDVLCVLYTN